MTHLRIVSGGQTGVDRAALDAAIDARIDCGGWCPHGRRTEDGPLAPEYPLREAASRNYATRTRWNVRDSDATLIVVRTMPEMSDGTLLTARTAERLGRPLLVIDLTEAGSCDAAAARIAAWIVENAISVLNVAGPRESRSPGIYAAVRPLVSAVIGRLTR